MRYLWLDTVTGESREEIREKIRRLLREAKERDGHLPLLNLPETIEDCDGCLVAVAQKDGAFPGAAENGPAVTAEENGPAAEAFAEEDMEPTAAPPAGVLTCLYAGSTVEVSLLVHPDYRGQGIGMGLLHELARTTEKVPVFPVLPEDERAVSFLRYIGKTEVYREMLMTLTRKTYRDAKPKAASGRLRVTCRKPRDGAFFYELFLGFMPVGQCRVTEGCISHVEIRSLFRGKGYGSFLLRTVIRHQFRSKTEKLMLQVTDRNTAACALYRKYGFAVGEEIAYYV